MSDLNYFSIEQDPFLFFLFLFVLFLFLTRYFSSHVIGSAAMLSAQRSACTPMGSIQLRHVHDLRLYLTGCLTWYVHDLRVHDSTSLIYS